MARKLMDWNWRRWPWSPNDGGEPERSAEPGAEGQQAKTSEDSNDVRNLRTVIAELAKELRKSKDGLQNDGVAVSSATATLRVEINNGEEAGARLSFTVPGIGGLGAGGKGQQGSEMTTTIQVVLSPETPNRTAEDDGAGR
jgi:Trypsin-co-occurring domain 2